MESVVKNILKRRAKSFSQSAEFQQYLKALFDEACEDRAGITNSEVYTLVLQLYICELLIQLHSCHSTCQLSSNSLPF